MVKILRTVNSDLIFDWDIDDWCRVKLRIKDAVWELGADARQIVFKRLQGALRESLGGDVVGSIEGVDVVWVLSLSEEHCSIYAGDKESRRVLFLQDRNADLIACVELDTAQCKEWFNSLQPDPA